MDPNQSPQTPPSASPTPPPAPQGPAPVVGQPLPAIPPAPQQPVNPYAFITNPGAAPKKAPLIAAGSLRARMALVGGVGLALIIIVLVGSSLLGGKSSDNAVLLQGLLAEQQEIMRIATYGTTESRDANTLNLAVTTLESVASDQFKLDAYLDTKKIKTTPVQLAAKKDAETDKALAEAQQNNNFDTAFKTKLSTMLTSYLTNTKAAYDTASTSLSKTILENTYNSAEILAKSYGQTAAN